MATQTGRYSGKMTGGKPPIPDVQNGRIPLSKLQRCTTQTRAEHPFLYAPAAKAFDAMTKAAREDSVIIEAVALYRDYQGQVTMRKIWCARGECGNAAVPGRSSHGWGTAADINRHDHPKAIPWLMENAIRFGWDHPMWAGPPMPIIKNGKVIKKAGPEPWHWQFIQGFALPNETITYVRGKVIEEADTYIEEGRSYVALRPVVTAMNGLITGFRTEEAFVDFGEREGWVPLENRNGRGFSPAKELAQVAGVDIKFDGKALRIG